MGLLTENTKWVLFLSDPTPEPRHIFDLFFGVMCLEKAGVNPVDIYIYINGSSEQISHFLSIASPFKYTIKPSDLFFQESEKNTHENLVMFVTGHGSPSGIHSAVPITPNQLVTTLKKTPNLNNAIVYLGQCYAGLFNYVNAGRSGKSHEPDVIFIGATNLHESFSHPTSEMFLPRPFAWPANLFLLHVFKWISSRVDVDGDGRMTVMDSYKYAGVHANMHNKKFKAENFTKMVDQHHGYKLSKEKFATPSGDPDLDASNELEFKAAEVSYKNSLDLHYIHQESWILNSYPAQKIEF